MQKKIQSIFIFISVVACIIFFRNIYVNYQFDSQPLGETYLREIDRVEVKILDNMYQVYGFKARFPIVITDKIPGKIYGVTVLDQEGVITIYLNKKVMKESFDYVLSDVIAHEYAHALLFKKGHIAKEGHSALWQQTCTKLGGANCQKYVDSHDVIMNKLPF